MDYFDLRQKINKFIDGRLNDIDVKDLVDYILRAKGNDGEIRNALIVVLLKMDLNSKYHDLLFKKLLDNYSRECYELYNHGKYLDSERHLLINRILKSSELSYYLLVDNNYRSDERKKLIRSVANSPEYSSYSIVNHKSLKLDSIEYNLLLESASKSAASCYHILRIKDSYIIKEDRIKLVSSMCSKINNKSRKCCKELFVIDIISKEEKTILFEFLLSAGEYQFLCYFDSWNKDEIDRIVNRIVEVKKGDALNAAIHIYQNRHKLNSIYDRLSDDLKGGIDSLIMMFKLSYNFQQ